MDSAEGRHVMRLSDLRDKTVRTLDGETLGRVHDVHADKGTVTALMCGPGSFLERLTARKEGRRIPWEFVKRVEAMAIVVASDPPQTKPKKASASRSRQGTRRPSAPRSKR
jgi:sporulation protein YlmC with PRC-barrel domain